MRCSAYILCLYTIKYTWNCFAMQTMFFEVYKNEARKKYIANNSLTNFVRLSGRVPLCAADAKLRATPSPSVGFFGRKKYLYTHMCTRQDTGSTYPTPRFILVPFPFASQHHVLLSISDLRCLFLEHRHHRRRRRQRQKSDLFPLRMRETNSHTPPNYGLRRAWWKGQRKWKAKRGRTGDFSVPERPVARAMDIGSSFCPTWDAFPLHTRCEDGMRDPIPQKAECARSTAHRNRTVRPPPARAFPRGPTTCSARSSSPSARIRI